MESRTHSSSRAPPLRSIRPAGFAEDWVWDGAYETYVDDEEMAAKLRRSNPQAFANVVRRLLEASGRGMWDADPEARLVADTLADPLSSAGVVPLLGVLRQATHGPAVCCRTD